MAVFLIDREPVDDPRGRWWVEASSSFPIPVPVSSELVELPFMDSAVKVRGRRPPATFALAVFVRNDGNMSLDPLIGRLQTVAGRVEAGSWLGYRNDRDTWNMREAQILRCAVSQPERVEREGARVVFELTLAPYWRDPDMHTVTVPLSGQSRQRVQLEPFRDSTAPLVDAVVTVSGPFTRLQLDAGGTGVTVKTRVSAGESVVIDCENHSVTMAGEKVAFDYPGGGFLQIPAPPEGDPYPAVTATVAGTDRSYSELTVEGHTWYL